MKQGLNTFVPSLLCRFHASQNGTLVVKFALAIPILLLTVGTAIDYGTTHSRLTTLQSAVDAGAIAAAKELGLADAKTSNTSSVVNAVVKAYLIENYGQEADASGVTISTSVTNDPLTVHVIATEKPKMHFGNAFGMTVENLKAEAVARVAGQPNICVLGLDPNETATISVEHGAHIVGNDCAVYSNSSDEKGLRAKDSAQVEASLICSRGGLDGSRASFTPEPIVDCPSYDDPLASRPEPMVGSCRETGLSVNKGTHILKPGTYCGGIVVTSGAEVIFESGVYVIKDGPLLVTGGGSINGENTSFYFTGTDAVFNFGPNSSVSLTAPQEGDMAGILMFEGRSQPTDSKHMITSNDARTLLGTIYLPRGELKIDTKNPVADQSAYTAIIARAMRLSGDPTLVLNTNYDRTEIPVPDGVQSPGLGVTLVK